MQDNKVYLILICDVYLDNDILWPWFFAFTPDFISLSDLKVQISLTDLADCQQAWCIPDEGK